MTNLTHTTNSISAKNIKHEWRVVDIGGQILGRTASQIAIYLMGKHKSSYVPYLDMGDTVVVINAKDIVLTGNKTKNKTYSSYSGYPGGLRKISVERLIEKKPEEIVKRAVSGMLPKNKLRDKRMARLYIFASAKHPYENKIKVK